MITLFWIAIILGSAVCAPTLFFDGFEIPKLFCVQVGICLFLLMAAIRGLWRGQAKLYLPLEALPLVGLFAIAALSIAWSYNRWLAVERLFQVGSLAACLFIAYGLYRDRDPKKAFYLVAFIGMIIASWSCLLDFCEPLRNWVYPYYSDNYRSVISNQGNPNFTLHILVLTTPATIGLLLSTGRRWLHVFLSGGVIVQLSCFGLSQNRPGLFALIFALMVFGTLLLVFKREVIRRHRAFLIIQALGVVGCLVIFAFSNRGDNWMRRIRNLENLENIDVYSRVVFLETGWEMFKDDPLLGKGIGQFVIHFPGYKTEKHWDKFKLQKPDIFKWRQMPPQAHNEYLQVLIETGAVGLVCFLIFPALLFSHCWWLLKGQRYPSFMIAGFTAGMAGVLFNSLFTFPLQTITSGILFWATAGLLLACGVPTTDFRMTLSRKALAAVAAIALVGLWGSCRIIKAENLFMRGIVGHAQNLSASIELNKEAARLLPYRFEMQYVTGWLGLLAHDREIAYTYFNRTIRVAPWFPPPHDYLKPDSIRRARKGD
ncbi:hypothetical protein LCGC14_1307400 [marine sediment metagenome]|uniref:O-antigen ligase-related domain-containing protein n=1 Tax=marine sediment metagenome TaxID=412755 RepID=A0A0F9L874_9ZZZZ